jgi:hypothetical protein
MESKSHVQDRRSHPESVLYQGGCRISVEEAFKNLATEILGPKLRPIYDQTASILIQVNLLRRKSRHLALPALLRRHLTNTNYSTTRSRMRIWGRNLANRTVPIRGFKLKAVLPEECFVPSHAMDQFLSRDIFGRFSVSNATTRSGRIYIDTLDSSFGTIRTPLLLVAFDLALTAKYAGYLVRGSLTAGRIGGLESHG